MHYGAKKLKLRQLFHAEFEDVEERFAAVTKLFQSTDKCCLLTKDKGKF